MHLLNVGTILLLGTLATAVPSRPSLRGSEPNLQINIALSRPHTASPHPHLDDGPVPGFNDARIADHPDKNLLSAIRAYFVTFVKPDPPGMRAMQGPEYTMTDIPLGVVNVDKDTWYGINTAFVQMATNTSVTALSLSGSAEPGAFSVLENLVEFTLTMDPPPGPDRNLPAGAKKGDRVGMVMLSTIWWGWDDDEGRVQVERELEYGRLVWDGFTLDAWDHSNTDSVYREL